MVSRTTRSRAPTLRHMLRTGLHKIYREICSLKEEFMATSAQRAQEYRDLVKSLEDSRTEILAKIDEYANAAAGTPEESAAL